MTKSEHPSFYQLDHYALRRQIDAEVDPSLKEHVEACEACSAHVHALLTEEAADEPLPAWVQSLSKAPQGGPQRGTAPSNEETESLLPLGWIRRVFVGLERLLRFPVGAPAGFVVAALAVVFVFQRSEPRYDTVRGNPAVQVIVKRGERLIQWQEDRLLQPGDRFRLEVAPDGLGHVSVALLEEAENITILYAGAVNPNGKSILPPAWELDDAPGPEHLLIVMSEQPITATDIKAAWPPPEDTSNLKDLWLRHLVLKKKTSGDAHPLPGDTHPPPNPPLPGDTHPPPNP